MRLMGPYKGEFLIWIRRQSHGVDKNMDFPAIVKFFNKLPSLLYSYWRLKYFARVAVQGS